MLKYGLRRKNWRTTMNNYIKQWLEIIENMNNDNTYKLAWGRAIIELCQETNQLDKQITFTFHQIAKK